jgi:hypothetical protein
VSNLGIDHAYHAARSATTRHGWLEPVARAGYAAKGVLYSIIGVLALMVAFGEGGSTTGSEGALAHLASSTFGGFLVGITGIGLVAYTLWQVVRAAFDPEHDGETGGMAIARRIGFGASAILHGALAVAAVQILATGSSSQGDNSTWAGSLMDSTGGLILLVTAGLLAAGYGIFQLVKAKTVDFRKELKSNEMSHTTQTWAERIGRIGYAARGVVFILMGGSLVTAAATHDPSEAEGIGGVLSDIASAPFGAILLGLVAFGLAAYGVFMFVLARYRRIPA